MSGPLGYSPGLKPGNPFELENWWAIGGSGLVTYPDKAPHQHGRKLEPSQSPGRQ